jgi:glycosyltransferase involved in cell wall biosynthesis
VIRAVGVVVPAHNEQDLLPSCLASLHRSARDLRASPSDAPGTLPVHLVVVADACRDATAKVARRGGASVVSIGARNVGMARAAGVREVLGRTARLDPADVWIATTDADTVVPPDWLDQQIRYASGGWDAVVGTIRVADWSGHPPRVRARFLERYGAWTSRANGEVSPGGGELSRKEHLGGQRLGGEHLGGEHLGGEHPHVHGANLGFRAAAYLRTGGFPELPTGEDHALVASLAGSGGKVLRTDAVTVVTSARMQAHAPSGFAAYLLGLAASG